MNSRNFGHKGQKLLPSVVEDNLWGITNTAWEWSPAFTKF